jgi:hypothetical protein
MYADSVSATELVLDSSSNFSELYSVDYSELGLLMSDGTPGSSLLL